MGAHGDAMEARNARKANVKKGDKKKFKDRNSIGKTKKKVGSAGKYTTRTQAVKKLQARTAQPHAARLARDRAASLTGSSGTAGDS